MSGRALVIVLATVIATGHAAHAGRSATSLSWTRLPGAETCIGAPELARAVEARIGDVLVTPAHADLSIEGRIVPRRGGGWSAVVAVARAGEPATSQRTLDTRDPSCHVLDTPLALVIALLIDPSGAPPVPAQAAHPAVEIREVRIEVPVLVHEPWRVAVAGFGDVEHGVLPRVAVGGVLALELEPPGLPRLELAAFDDRSQDTATDLPGRTVATSLVGGSLAVCPSFVRGGGRLLACAGGRLSRVAWSGHGFEHDLTGSAIVPAVMLDGRVEWPLGSRFSVIAGAGVRVPLRDVEVSYQRSPAAGGGDVRISDPSRVSLWVGLGLLARLTP